MSIYVAARAWISATTSGQVIGQFNSTDPLPPASLTKLASAIVVANMVDEDSSLLHREIRVTPFAAALRGTRANLRTGDILSVLDLLYGMLLPSGNDAAVALAEGLGESFALRNKSRLYSVRESARMTSASKVRAWVIEMNATAARLGLRCSAFRNAHGMDEKGHFSCAEVATDALF
jgi:serine-type D-Ala-D-Ala carboxypeptidase (penicillin-binding protein 5/6)